MLGILYLFTQLIARTAIDISEGKQDFDAKIDAQTKNKLTYFDHAGVIRRVDNNNPCAYRHDYTIGAYVLVDTKENKIIKYIRDDETTTTMKDMKELDNSDLARAKKNKEKAIANNEEFYHGVRPIKDRYRKYECCWCRTKDDLPVEQTKWWGTWWYEDLEYNFVVGYEGNKTSQREDEMRELNNARLRPDILELYNIEEEKVRKFAAEHDIKF